MKKVFAASLGCPSLESQFAMINCTVLKLLGDFNIAKNPSIITKFFFFALVQMLVKEKLSR